ncbi:MAG TPA: site-2 protease family protein [Blastocatellia bacterium]|nr:site-2 protease family protein [Blastocatellia bacterium]
MENTEQYRLSEVPAAPSTIDREVVFIDTPDTELSARRILLHTFLFFVTAMTTTVTGASWVVQVKDNTPLDWLIGPTLAVIRETLAGNFFPLTEGLIFTTTLLVILAAHEFGHYFACRYYGIRATLPFFLPAPPTVTLFGTFGAVIKIKAPINSRRALFDIGIAGPLAGFAVALPASIIGLAIAKPAPFVEGLPTEGLQFMDPPLFKLIAWVLGTPPLIDWNPVYWAAWGTLLVTALNLFPVGQLDGGHVVYAVLGKRIHKWVSRAVVVATAALSITAFVKEQPPVYGFWTLVLLFLLKVGHPPVVEDEPLGRGRVILAIVALIVFLLCFMPFPVSTL